MCGERKRVTERQINNDWFTLTSCPTLSSPTIADMSLHFGFFMDLDFDVHLLQIMFTCYLLAALVNHAYLVFWFEGSLWFMESGVGFAYSCVLPYSGNTTYSQQRQKSGLMSGGWASMFLSLLGCSVHHLPPFAAW